DITISTSTSSEFQLIVHPTTISVVVVCGVMYAKTGRSGHEQTFGAARHSAAICVRSCTSAGREADAAGFRVAGRPLAHRAGRPAGRRAVDGAGRRPEDGNGAQIG